MDKPGYFLRHFEGLVDLEAREGARDPDNFADDTTFYIRRDKYFPGYLSFEPVNKPGHFIHRQGYRLKLSAADDSELFKNDASWKAFTDLPGRFIVYK